MYETYEEWQEYIKSNIDPHYYSNLYRYHDEILQDLKNNLANIVADKLQVQATKLSIIKQMLLAYKGL